ncbi:MAG: zinc metalloprotease [Candidatus Eisenbacteria bacterium]|uniref:Zinc metalloprotease n=1 Tax=Eiseniibacteriota bacterium TaxID=2212470 RepID=A0A538TZ43_UNCEI|nr:MAG: zinc metalloprotease [Candidatus Eisenbacteria bacterium]
MRSRSLSCVHSPGFLLALLCALAPPARALETASIPFTDRACATIEPSSAEAQAIQQSLQEPSATESGLGGVVQVALHVIWNGVDGAITDAQVEEQIEELNEDFSGASGGWDTGYRFVLTSVDRTLDANWFDLAMGSNNERRMKEALAVDPLHHVNVYTARISALGWSSFPWDIAEDDVHQGIVIHYGSVPGGAITNFNLGRTLTHEMGHYFGLFHVFFTGCLEPNDYVSDTPAEAQATTGCPPDSTDTCSSMPGVDPIHNYLDYSYDACYSQFTAGQDARMDGMLQTYRPHFLAAPLAVDSPRASRDASLWPVIPTPSTRSAKLVFALRREGKVTLRVHDLAGRVVATLVDGILPAGHYTQVFAPSGGASGVYFAVLTAEGEHVAQRLVLTR